MTATFSEIKLANLAGFVQIREFHSNGELLEHLKFGVSPRTPRMAIKYSENCMKKKHSPVPQSPHVTHSYYHPRDLQFMPLPGSVVFSANMGKSLNTQLYPDNQQ